MSKVTEESDYVAQKATANMIHNMKFNNTGGVKVAECNGGFHLDKLDS